MNNKSYDEMVALKKEFSKLYFNIDNVVGIGIGFYGDSTCIKVNLEKDLPHNLPKEYKGVKVNYDVTGRAYFL